MKKILLLALLAVLQLPLMAQNCLTITLKNGEKLTFAFADKPVLTFNETDIVISTDKTEVHFDLEGGLQFEFDEIKTKVESPESDRRPGDFSIKENTVTLTGAKANMAVRVYGMDGKVLLSTKTDGEGFLSFSIENLPAGTYVMKSETITCKILKL